MDLAEVEAVLGVGSKGRLLPVGQDYKDQVGVEFGVSVTV